MNIKAYITYLGAILLVTLLSSGCSDQFLQDKKDFTNTTDDVFNYYSGALGRINDLYTDILPNSTSEITYERPSAGAADDHSKSTEEYSGLSRYVDPEVIIASTDLPSYWGDENKTSRSTYGRIRNCNDAIWGISNSSLSQEEKEELLGQAYFLRAWMYLHLVKIYGGVPLVKEVQNPVAGDDDGADLIVPRSTTKECIDFICDDLSIAAKYLPVSWGAGNYGRVTAGTALALQGRARLLYASPLYNRADDQDRWALAYQSNKNALDTLSMGGFGLAYLDNPGVNASNWAKMFSDYTSPEAVFVTLYNRIVDDGGSTNPFKNNGWENSIRPKNTGAGNGKNATATMVDLFPMADGMKPGQSETYPYNQNNFMLNRDPRFYRTFAFAGVRWAFDGDPTSKGADFPYTGTTYTLWNYAWYQDTEKRDDGEQKGFAADGLGIDYQGVYIRKRTDDRDINNSPLYDYRIDKGTSPFGGSAAPYMEIRFAEVLLNFAEAACGANKPVEAVSALQQIRARVGYTADNNYGLDADLASDRGKLFAAILYERQVELAYEGKRFDDMRRWMLWDGGEGQGSLSPSFALSGFGGNTCTYLGAEPFNGKRRDNLELRVSDNVGDGIANANRDSDPVKVDRPSAWNLTTQKDPSVELVDFYTTKLTRKERLGDSNGKYVDFKPKYYFLGLSRNVQQNNVTLKQTVGWEDLNNGNAPGTFDPLAE
ncbi:RagB/SusD family nutrient uptake outer membrane protein [Mangrovibacterium sp.]|uniref:RagB/SusD family nutrient uptake outer membrane protein n=1 Tax=Mangrovibacterium sp. TaxID=1961364 RepID=UPI00356AAC6F